MLTVRFGSSIAGEAEPVELDVVIDRGVVRRVEISFAARHRGGVSDLSGASGVTIDRYYAPSIQLRWFREYNSRLADDSCPESWTQNRM